MTDNKAGESRQWLGRKTERWDIITPRQTDNLSATFAPFIPESGFSEELLWLLAPDSEPQDALGPDGHPKLGLYLPDMGFERRMWAGGQISFYAPVPVMETITKISEIAAITPKEGKSGNMVFVSVKHSYHAGATHIADEIQQIVYRQAVAQAAYQGGDRLPAYDRQSQWQIKTNSTLLFRYSALTFNGHRIHYDADFAKNHEGHEGLMLHGPIQASWLMMLAKQHSGESLGKFTYRSVAPFICGQTAHVTIGQTETKISGTVQNETGQITMTAQIELRK
ncbi:MAG: hypothetical protein ACON49_05915 [Candidatus Puniceispirillaceae bacterium]